MAVFRNNGYLSKACGVAAAGLVPWWLISMLSIKYDEAKWSKHWKTATCCLLIVGVGFNYSLQSDASFFGQMRDKYLSELSDDQLCNFDRESQIYIQ